MDFTGGRAGSEQQRQDDGVGLWSCETSRDAHATPDTAGTCGLKCALVKAGTLVMQVEVPVWGCGHRSAEPEARRAPGSRWGQVVPVGPCLSPAFASRWPWQSPWGGRPCSAEKKGSKCFPRWSRSWHLSSLTSAPLALTGPYWLPAASLQLPAPGAPLAGTASPARAGSREQRGALLRGPAPSGP